MSEHLCLTCKYAEWNRTKAGRIHPSGDGWCRAPIPDFQIPAAFHWRGDHLGYKPYSGGQIERRPMWMVHAECSFHEEAG